MVVLDRPASQQAKVGRARERLDALDLSMVMMKLSDPVEGKGWSALECERAETEYRKFLALNLAHPDEAIVPCELVDEVWHSHILDTRAYAADCAAIFGEFFHHFPYFGLRGAEDAAQLERAYGRTRQLYEEAFGNPPAGTWGVAGMKCGRTACKPQKCKSDR